MQQTRDIFATVQAPTTCALRSDMALLSRLCYLILDYQFCGSLLVNRLFRVQKHPKIKDFLD